jgi:hypothetical protein
VGVKETPPPPQVVVQPQAVQPPKEESEKPRRSRSKNAKKGKSRSRGQSPAAQGPSDQRKGAPAEGKVPLPEKPRAVVDASGTKRSTWKARLREARQRLLESDAAFRISALEKQAAILCNAYWTLQEQWNAYRNTELFSGNEADPFRDLRVKPAVIVGMATILESSGWKRNLDNRHFVIQAEDGKSLRGEQIFEQGFFEVPKA